MMNRQSMFMDRKTIMILVLSNNVQTQSNLNKTLAGNSVDTDNLFCVE